MSAEAKPIIEDPMQGRKFRRADEFDPEAMILFGKVLLQWHDWIATFGLKIVLVFRDEAQISKGQVVMGTAQKATPREKELYKVDGWVILARDIWNTLEDTQRTALLDHELSHFAMGDTGLKITGHDLEEFAQVYRRHGAWEYHLRKFISIQPELPGMEFPQMVADGDEETVELCPFSGLPEHIFSGPREPEDDDLPDDELPLDEEEHGFEGMGMPSTWEADTDDEESDDLGEAQGPG